MEGSAENLDKNLDEDRLGPEPLNETRIGGVLQETPQEAQEAQPAPFSGSEVASTCEQSVFESWLMRYRRRLGGVDKPSH